jgi:DNA polymerase III subunit epsilon
MIGSWLQGLRRHASPTARRWIMIDVETTGLDPRSDALLCVAALAMDLRHAEPQLVVADSFEVVIRQSSPTASHDNVLLHGIGWGQQRQGVPARDALSDLMGWVSDSPLLAYHAAFDQQVLQQAFKGQRMTRPQWAWLDLADLLPAAFPEVQARSLDQWMQALNVRCVKRHQAAADVWATAQLFLKAWPRWQSQGLVSWQDLSRKADEVRWLRVSASAARL